MRPGDIHGLDAATRALGGGMLGPREFAAALGFDPLAVLTPAEQKTVARLPFGLKNRLALALSGRPFYPGEDDYCFELESAETAHALLAVAR